MAKERVGLSIITSHCQNIGLVIKHISDFMKEKNTVCIFGRDRVWCILMKNSNEHWKTNLRRVVFVQNSLLSDQIASHEELDRIVRVNNGKSIIYRSLFSKVKDRLVEDFSRAAQPTIHLPALSARAYITYQ